MKCELQNEVNKLQGELIKAYGVDGDVQQLKNQIAELETQVYAKDSELGGLQQIIFSAAFKSEADIKRECQNEIADWLESCPEELDEALYKGDAMMIANILREREVIEPESDDD